MFGNAAQSGITGMIKIRRMAMKVLESKHIYLSTYEDKYLSDLYEWENNLNELNKWNSDHKKIYSCAKFKNKIENLNDNNEYDNYFFIIDKKGEQLVGYVGYAFIDLENGNFFAGTYIKPGYRKSPINTEAWLIFLDYMFQYFPVKKVVSSVLDFNKNSLDNITSAGFKIEGIRKRHAFVQGEYHDEYLIAMFKDEFYNLFDKFKKYISLD